MISRERLYYLAVEVVAIVLSVLLALAVNEWRQNRSHRALVQLVMDSVRSEIEKNQQDITRAIAYHDSLIQAIRDVRHTHPIMKLHIKQHRIDPSSAESLNASLKNALKKMGIPSWIEFSLERSRDGRFIMHFPKSDLSGFAEITGDTLHIHSAKGVQLKHAFVQNNAWNVALATQAPSHMDYRIVAQMAEIHQLQTRYLNIADTILDMLYTGKFRLPPLEDLRHLEGILLDRYQTILPLLKSK